MGSPSWTCQSSCIRGTLRVLSTFSYGLTPVWSSSNRKWGQFVRTVNGACAVSPLVDPRAFTWVCPGRAEAGIWMVVENAPDGSVVAEPTGTGPNRIWTVSLAPNPWPVTATVVVGGPDCGSMAMDAPAARAGDATRARPRTNAATTRANARSRTRAMREASPQTAGD